MNILVLLPLSETQRAAFAAAVGAEAEIAYADRHDVSDDAIARAEVIVGNLPAKRLAAAGKLRLLQLNSAGYDGYDAPGVMPQGAALASAVGAYGQAVSEHLFAMLLALMKRLPAYRDLQRAHTWGDEGAVTSLVGATVLVLGTGDLGRHFAELVRAVGATTVMGARRHADTVPAGFDAVYPLDGLEPALAQADVVASFLPSSPQTRHLADRAFFAACKPGAYFVNGGRGDLVDQDALIDALNTGHIAGAALDVTDPEPLPTDHPLWDAPGVLITPHVAGGFHLPVVLDNIVQIAGENIRHLAAGEPLRNRVL